MEVTAPPGDVASLPEREADEPGPEDGVEVQARVLVTYDGGDVTGRILTPPQRDEIEILNKFVLFG